MKNHLSKLLMLWALVAGLCTARAQDPAASPVPRLDGAPAEVMPGTVVPGQGRIEIKPAPEIDDSVPVDDSKEPGTEIFADHESVFDATNRTATFTGNVKIIDPRFQMKTDKLTVYMSKKEDKFDRAVAEGNVIIVHQNMKDGKPDGDRAVGRAARAVYRMDGEEIVLSGFPQLTQGVNVHKATSASTTMTLKKNGELKTDGPAKTELKQTDVAKPSPSPSPGRQ